MNQKICLLGLVALLVAGCCNRASESTRRFYVQMFRPNDKFSHSMIAEANRRVALLLVEEKAYIDWEVYVVPIDNGIKLVFVPLFPGYDISDGLKDRIVQEVETVITAMRLKDAERASPTGP